MTEPTDAERFARSRLIPGWDPGRLVAATAVVAGVGALGNEVAKNLALAGVGRLVLCDPDTVATTNLSRTVLFGPECVGRAKPLAAATALGRLCPDTAVEARCADLTSGVGLGELAAADLVLGCLDSIHARMALLGRCALVDAPLVDGGTNAWGGEVRLRLDLDQACFACALSPHQRGVSDLPWSCAEPPAGPAAASIVATSMVASWMTLVALRVLLGTPPEIRLVGIDGLAGRAGPVQVARDPDCPHHTRLPPAAPVAVANTGTVAELVTALPPGAEPTAWTRFALPRRCPACDLQDIAVTAPDAVVPCPRCHTLVRARFTERLLDAAPDARLCDLGVAPCEILTVRTDEGVTWRTLSATST